MSADEAVLICEPEEKEAAVIRDILTVDGFRVTSTSTAADAAQAMRDAPWTLLLISLSLPALERAELLEQTRSASVPPLVAFLGDVNSEEALAVARSHGHTILSLPVEPDKLKLLAWEAARQAEKRRNEMRISGIDTEPGTMRAPDIEDVLARAAGLPETASHRPDTQDGALGTSLLPASGAQVTNAAESDTSSPGDPAHASTSRPGTAGVISNIIDQASEDLEALVRLKDRLAGAFELLKREEQTIQRLVEEKERLVAKTNEIEESLNAQLEQFQAEASQMVTAVEEERKQAEASRDEALERVERLEEELEEARRQLHESERKATERAEAYERLEQRGKELKNEAANAWSSLVYAVGSIITGLPDPAVAVNKTMAIIGASRPLAALLGTQANRLIGQPAAQVLPASLQDLIARAADGLDEPGLALELVEGANPVQVHAVGHAVKSGKAGIRVLFLYDENSTRHGTVRRPEGDVTALIEDFKERLFSIRLLTETISTRAENEKIREIAGDVTADVDKLVSAVDDIFKAD